MTYEKAVCKRVVQMVGRTSTTVSPASPAAHLLELILEKRRVTVRHLSYALELSIETAHDGVHRCNCPTATATEFSSSCQDGATKKSIC